MADELEPGIHESLVTEDLRARIVDAERNGWVVEWKTIDDAALPDVLARHVHDQVLSVVGGLPKSLPDRRRTQIAIANRVLGAMTQGDRMVRLIGPEVDPEACLLLEVKRPLVPHATTRSTPRPGIPLRDSVLLVNGHKDLQIGRQVALEIQSANRIDLLCAFVRFAGLRLIRAELQEFLLRGGEMRVIASVYTGSTEKRALDELVGLGAIPFS